MNLLAGRFARETGERTSGAQGAPSFTRRPRPGRGSALARPTRLVAAVSALLLPVVLGLQALPATALPAPVGNGFTVTPTDLAFILKQIKIAERHSRAFLGDPSLPANPNVPSDPNYCQSMVGTGPDQIPDALLSFGLRTVDGSCNNLIPRARQVRRRRRTVPAADQSRVQGRRGSSGRFLRSGCSRTGFFVLCAEDGQRLRLAAADDQQPDRRPDVDQPGCRRGGRLPGPHPGQHGHRRVYHAPDGYRGRLPPEHKTLFIPNVTTDVGLSPPYNSLFTFFGQFFDHGVDQTVKSGGTVFVPLKADDPLMTVGPDGIAGTNCGTPAALHCDEVPPSQAFMVLTRAQNQRQGGTTPRFRRLPTSAIQNANNTDTPWVDQSQTYTSHASHQVFLREYVDNAASHRSRPQVSAVTSRPTTCAGRDDGNRHLGGGQAAGRDQARAQARRHGRDEHPDDRHRPVRQVHPGSPSRTAAVRDEDRSGRGQPRRPGTRSGQRTALRHAVPDGHRAQRRPVRQDPTTPATPTVSLTPTRQHARRTRVPACRHLRRRDARRALLLR